MNRREGWVSPREEEPVTPEGMAEYMENMKRSHALYEEFIAEKVRIIAYWRREVMAKEKPTRRLKAV